MCGFKSSYNVQGRNLKSIFHACSTGNKSGIKSCLWLELAYCLRFEKISIRSLNTPEPSSKVANGISPRSKGWCRVWGGTFPGQVISAAAKKKTLSKNRDNNQRLWEFSSTLADLRVPWTRVPVNHLKERGEENRLAWSFEGASSCTWPGSLAAAGTSSSSPLGLGWGMEWRGDHRGAGRGPGCPLAFTSTAREWEWLRLVGFFCGFWALL